MVGGCKRYLPSQENVTKSCASTPSPLSVTRSRFTPAGPRLTTSASGFSSAAYPARDEAVLAAVGLLSTTRSVFHLVDDDGHGLLEIELVSLEVGKGDDHHGVELGSTCPGSRDALRASPDASRIMPGLRRSRSPAG